MDESQILFTLLSGMQHYGNTEETGGHMLPPGFEARMLENQNWREPTLNAPPMGKDLFGITPESRYESLAQAAATALLYSLVPKDKQWLRDSLMATQAFNTEQRLNKTGAPTALLFNTRW